LINRPTWIDALRQIYCLFKRVKEQVFFYTDRGKDIAAATRVDEKAGEHPPLFRIYLKKNAFLRGLFFYSFGAAAGSGSVLGV